MSLRARFTTKGFQTKAGGREQIIVVRPRGESGFSDQRKEMAEAYRGALQDLNLAPESAVFRRVFLSDAMNQAPLLAGGSLSGGAEDPVALSLIEQPPLPHGKMTLLAYHVSDPKGLSKHRLDPHHLIVEKNGTRHVWSTRLCAGAESFPASAEAQTRDVFAKLIAALDTEHASLARHCVRTWLYVKGIDVFYPGMVTSRKELFAEHGLRSDTHYIAATGIEGACAHRFDVVAMDAYSQLDLRPGQLSYLNDFTRLSATNRYGVTFERAAMVSYRDRRQIFLSGTASIDSGGRVVHAGDVLAQLTRALDNVSALMRAGSASLADLLYLIVYLRDRADARAVEAALAERLPGLPLVLVAGAVCRPEWLVEVEGIGVAAQPASTSPDLPDF